MTVSLSLVILLLGLTGAVKRRKQLPISDPSSASKQSKASECRFGGNAYELEQTWHPDLGAPFGIMYCVHCVCVPIHKKRRIVGRVRCKNIKTECPKPSCSDPVLLPGRCCKVCPGQMNNPDEAITVDLEREEQEQNGRHYASVLMGSNNADSATGRFYFRKKSLQYSFLTSPGLGWPHTLQFIDSAKDNILEEFALTRTPLQNNTGKICGAWNRLPRSYRKTLRSLDLQVTLTSMTGVATGKIARYYGLSSELFSGLLQGDYGAGTAIVSVSSGTGSIHVNLLFEGLIPQDVVAPISITVTFTTDTQVLEETTNLDTVTQGLNSIEIKTVFDAPMLASLGAGDLILTVFPTTQPGRSLSTPLVPKLTCDLFDCILASEDPSDSRGMAFMYFNKDGGLKYNIRVENMDSVTGITIDNGKKSRRLLSVVEGLEAGYNNGWANGTVYISGSQVEEMFKEDMYINIATNHHQQALRGRLLTRLAGPAEASGRAILLHGSDSPVSGIAWASIDTDCRLHYHLRTNDPEDDGEARLELEDFPLKNLKTLPLFPGTKNTLQECQGRKCSGHADDIHKLTMARMDSGDAALLLTKETSPSFSLAGKILEGSSPPECLPRYARNELELMPGFLSDIEEERGDTEMAETMKQKCYYESSVYEDGSQWEASHLQCTMCSCQRGSIKCESVVCPATNCSNPVIPEGECCPTCSVGSVDSSQGCDFEGDNMFHPAGSKWHPYIPPFGFSRCAVCTCKELTLTVDCEKLKCPRLDCLSTEAIRPGPMSCCKTCPVLPEPPVVELEDLSDGGSVLGDMAVEKTGMDYMRAGSCKWRGKYHSNGDRWHPRVMPWGEIKCVSCSCKDGQAKCKKKRCPKLSCPVSILLDNSCCPKCATSPDEIKMAQLSQSHVKKMRRMKKMRKMRRQRHKENPSRH